MKIVALLLIVFINFGCQSVHEISPNRSTAALGPCYPETSGTIVIKIPIRIEGVTLTINNKIDFIEPITKKIEQEFNETIVPGLSLLTEKSDNKVAVNNFERSYNSLRTTLVVKVSLSLKDSYVGNSSAIKSLASESFPPSTIERADAGYRTCP